MKVYMEITTDKYELPIVIADSMSGLAEICEVDRTSVWRCIRKNKGKRRSKYVEVEIGEIDDEQD